MRVDNGGAMYIDAGTVSFIDCHYAGNTAQGTLSSLRPKTKDFCIYVSLLVRLVSGGSVFVHTVPVPFTNCTFAENGAGGKTPLLSRVSAV